MQSLHVWLLTFFQPARLPFPFLLACLTEKHSCYHQPVAGEGKGMPFLSLLLQNQQLTVSDCHEPPVSFRKVKSSLPYYI